MFRKIYLVSTMCSGGHMTSVCLQWGWHSMASDAWYMDLGFIRPGFLTSRLGMPTIEDAVYSHLRSRKGEPKVCW